MPCRAAVSGGLLPVEAGMSPAAYPGTQNGTAVTMTLSS